MDFLRRITKAVDYIEQNLDSEIDGVAIAEIACCSLHQFSRVFSYVTDLPLPEYIRRRRMTLAALELQNGGIKVIDAALKYGYNSPDSFARAFAAAHGITPKEACVKGAKLKLYPRISFHITIKGDVGMDYRIIEKSSFSVVGIVHNFGKGFALDERRGDGKPSWWDEWERHKGFSLFFEGCKDLLREKYNLYHAPLWQVGITLTRENGDTVLAVGAEAGAERYDGLDQLEIPGGTWAVFTVKGEIPQSEQNFNQPVNEILASCFFRYSTLKNKPNPLAADKIFSRIETEWFGESGYERAENYEMMVYPPGEMSSEDYSYEIWIPVVKN